MLSSTISKHLSSGTFSTVYESDVGTAIKIYDEECHSIIPFVLEVSVLKYLAHFGIVNILATQLSPPMFEMPLASAVLSYNHVDTLEDRKHVFYQLFSAVAHCHKNGIWHRDIKPNNVLIFGDIVKLADFGNSSIFARADFKKDTDVVSLSWRAPELLLGIVTYDEKIDVWSLGIMLLYTQYAAFRPKTVEDQLQVVFNVLGIPPDLGQYREIWPELCEPRDAPQEWIEDIQELELINKTVTWKHDRVSASDALKLSYFNDVKLAPICHSQKFSYFDIQMDSFCGTAQSAEFREELCDILRALTLTDGYPTLFYAISLLDRVAAKLLLNTLEDRLLYARAASQIAIYLKNDELVNLAGIYADEVDVESAIKDITDMVDNQLIFITCNDYLYAMSAENNIINEYLYLLVLRYDYVIQYNQLDLAKIAMVLGGKEICAPINKEIYDYISMKSKYSTGRLVKQN